LKNLTSLNRSRTQFYLRPYNQLDEILSRIGVENEGRSSLITNEQVNQKNEGWIDNEHFNLLGLNFSGLFNQPRIEVANLVALQSQKDYLEEVRKQLLNIRPDPLTDVKDIGFRDHLGYVVRFEKGKPQPQGEATYDTAIAVVALATGNYNQDTWEVRKQIQLLRNY
jgi:hypothetical protein